MTWLTLPEVCDLLHANPAQVERWARRGLLGRRRTRDNGPMFPLDDVVAFAPEAAVRVRAVAPIAARAEA